MLASSVLATVSSAANGIQTEPTTTAKCSFQPYHQLCQPDLLQPASVSMLEWGISPFSRCFLCQTPPPVFRAVLSIATARPATAQGWINSTRYRPKQPIKPGKCSGNFARRRSQVRRLGNRPFSTSSTRNCWLTPSGCSRKANNALAVYRRRTIMMTNAFTINRSEYVFGRPLARLLGGGGLGMYSTRFTNLTRILAWCSIWFASWYGVVTRYYGCNRT